MRRALGIAALAAGATAAALAGGVAAQPPGQKQLRIDARPNPVVFGGSVTISGRLLGKNNDNKEIQLQHDPFPFASLSPLGTATTNTMGEYSFPGQKPLVNTRYQTKQGGNESSILTVLVRIRTSLSLSDSTPRRGQRVRFSGRACPEHDGAAVAIQRRTRTGWRTVMRTRLRDAGTACSTYRRTRRLFSDATYRTVVAGDADHARGISARRRANVHL
jgi:hypothetical protein